MLNDLIRVLVLILALMGGGMSAVLIYNWSMDLSDHNATGKKQTNLLRGNFQPNTALAKEQKEYYEKSEKFEGIRKAIALMVPGLLLAVVGGFMAYAGYGRSGGLLLLAAAAAPALMLYLAGPLAQGLFTDLYTLVFLGGLGLGGLLALFVWPGRKKARKKGKGKAARVEPEDEEVAEYEAV